MQNTFYYTQNQTSNLKLNIEEFICQSTSVHKVPFLVMYIWHY